MSKIEYNTLLFEVSERLDERNVLKQLLIMCRGMVATRSEDSIQDVFSLFEQLEEKGFLGLDRLEIMKDLLRGVKEWALFGKVKKLESKRKEYMGLLQQIIRVLDELNDLERLISMCREKMAEANEGNIHNVRALFKVLENNNCLGINCLDMLKEILTQTEQNDLLKEVEVFEERRNREDEFESRKAQATGLVSLVGNKLIGVLNIKTVFKVVAGGITVASTLEILSRGSTYDQLVNGVNRCVLPAGTSLIEISDGCVCLTVQAEDLLALTTLWSLYQDGTLKERLQTFFVTEKIRERAGGEEVEVIVTIEEKEYEKACVELTRKAQDANNQEERRPTRMYRRNSDSSLYCKARDGGGPKERTFQLENPVLNQAKYLERRAYVQRYLENAEYARRMTTEASDSGMPGTHGGNSEDAHSMTTETSDSGMPGTHGGNSEDARSMTTEASDSGMPGTHGGNSEDARSMTTKTSDSGMLGTRGAPSELGIEDTIDSGYKLCFSLKDLSEDMVKKVVASLEGDPISLAWFCHSFGLDREETPQYPRDLRELFRLFSGTPVQLLKDVCEALQLHDVVELLEKAKPPTLRPALPMKEIEKLTHSTKRPTTFYSKVTALTIDDGTSRTVSVSKRMGLIFEALNSRNKVITITAGPLDNLCGELRELKWKARRESKQQWVKKKLQKIEKEIDQKRDKLQKEKEKFQRALATVIDQWVHKEDKATLFAVFDLCDRDVEIAECLTKELALIAGDAKLVITPSCEGYKRIREIPETLHVEVKNSSDTKAFVDTMLEVLSKRWQTMDLISVMQEVQRSHVRRSMNCTWYHWSVPCKINDSLSSLPRLQKPEKTLNNGHE